MRPPADIDERIGHASACLARVGRAPFDFQVRAWRAFLEGRSGLVNAPTGTGKTLAAAGGPLLAEREPPTGLRLLWITPLRALANDLQVNLTTAAMQLEARWRFDLRTGDTPASRRRSQLTRPPHGLILTPESLAVMLSDAATHALLAKVDSVVVDEWHELLGSKRGVQLELCLAHLRAGNPALRTWGLSATLPNLEQARDVLVGPRGAGELIRGAPGKTTIIASVRPADATRFPWAGHLGLQLLDDVVARIGNARSTLLFTNTRSQAEVWYQAIANRRRDWLTELALHHGSIDRGIRVRIEDALREGRLRCVVATSSLDLGVDFTPVDQVIQVGSPKGVARLLQRAGRSGHQPGGRSEVVCVPTHAWELVEIAAAREGLLRGELEARVPLTSSLDVLVQHLVTLAAGPGFTAEAALAEARDTHAFRTLSAAAWRWAMDFVTRGGQALQGYPQFRRVQVQEGIHRIADARTARRHRMTIGTITSDAMMHVRFQSGGTLGSVEESFIGRLQPGDDFIFSGRTLTLLRVRDMTAYVSLSPRRSRQVPRWQGGRLPLSTELGALMLRLFSAPDPAALGHPELDTARPLIELQRRWSALPTPEALLVERHRSRAGHHLFVFPFRGRLVNEGLATLLAWRWSRARPQSFTLGANDYGFELLSPIPIDCDEASLRRGLDPANLTDDLLACVNFSELARRRFRDIARIAGLVFPGFPGAGKTTRQLQASSGLMFDVLTNHDAGNLLLDQARSEVFEAQLDVQRLSAALASLAEQAIELRETPRLTPMAFPLWADRLQSQTISSESWRDRVQRAAATLEKQAARGA